MRVLQVHNRYRYRGGEDAFSSRRSRCCNDAASRPRATKGPAAISARRCCARQPPWCTPIDERPRAVETREQFGHWEGDLMQFRTQRGNLLTLCETRFTFTAPLGNKQAETTDDALREIPRPIAGTCPPIGHLRQRQRIRPSEPQRRSGDANLLLRPPFPSAARHHRKPTASSAATCPEKSTFTTTPPGTSTTSPGPSTQHPENPSASKHPLKPSSKTSGPALYLLIQCKHRRSEGELVSVAFPQRLQRLNRRATNANRNPFSSRGFANAMCEVWAVDLRLVP